MTEQAVGVQHVAASPDGRQVVGEGRAQVSAQLDDLGLAERRMQAPERPIVSGSARNRFPGIVTRIEKDRVAAVVEVIAGPHRMVSLMTAEAVDEMNLKVGDEAVCVVKATNVIVEVPSRRESRG